MVQNAPYQGKPTLSVSDADQLDGSLCEISDRLESMVILSEDLVEKHYPAIPELLEIMRNVKSASQALEKAKSPARVLWNLSMEAAAAEGRS